MNPKIRTSCPMNEATMQWMLAAVKETTGLTYRYMAHETYNKHVISATLTLCGHGRKKVTKAQKVAIEHTIKGYGIGAALGIISVRWGV